MFYVIDIYLTTFDRKFKFLVMILVPWGHPHKVVPRAPQMLSRPLDGDTGNPQLNNLNFIYPQSTPNPIQQAMSLAQLSGNLFSSSVRFISLNSIA